jgi:ketose-bisphosphate aldolase
MPLVSMKQMLAAARRGGWAVAAFNPVDYGSMKAIIAAATSLEAPVILQTSAKTVKFYGHEPIVSWARELASASPAPITLHLDHGKDPKMIARCIETGWTSVMIDASDKPYEENLALTKEITALANKRGVGVEAELGEIGGVEEDIIVAEGKEHTADVEQALAFCREVDLAVFAPAIGTAHGFYKREPTIAWNVLEAISQRSGTPLALHGGTGLSNDIIQRCIRLGCAKINISTNLKHVFIDSFVTYHQEHPEEYEPLKPLAAQAAAVTALASEKIRQFGGAGKATSVGI